MFLRSLAIDLFRNLAPQRLHFRQQRSYFFGENAQGKTNLLEAIYLLCLGKSFRTSTDAEMIPLGREELQISGLFLDQNHIEHEIRCRYRGGYGKEVTLDGKNVQQLSSLVGRFPVVVLSVADYEITHGPPQQRRRFINILASQCSSRYLSDLKEYDKIIKQRNRILWQLQNGRSAASAELEVWDEQLVTKGMALIHFRRRISDALGAMIGPLYETVARSTGEPLALHYQPNPQSENPERLAENFSRQLTRMRRAEIARATSLVGPHRDEFIFTIGKRPLRLYGSRGEHKSALISLKAAELMLLKQHLETTPLLLLDDLYAELDQMRGEKVMQLFSGEGQCFITGTSADYGSLQHHLSQQQGQHLFFVRNGLFEESTHAQ